MMYFRFIIFSAARLARTKDSVQEISSSVGIQDANYFARVFKQYSGMTPSQYRSKRR